MLTTQNNKSKMKHDKYDIAIRSLQRREGEEKALVMPVDSGPDLDSLEPI